MIPSSVSSGQPFDGCAASTSSPETSSPGPSSHEADERCHPRTVSGLIAGTCLPEAQGSLHWQDWHHLQDALARLCSPGFHRESPGPLTPADEAAWQGHLISSGERIAHLFGRWLADEPAQLMQGLRALDVPALERSCAALALSLLRGKAQRAEPPAEVLKDIAELAALRQTAWSAISDHVDRLEGDVASLGVMQWEGPEDGWLRCVGSPPSQTPEYYLPAAYVTFWRQLAGANLDPHNPLNTWGGMVYEAG